MCWPEDIPQPLGDSLKLLLQTAPFTVDSRDMPRDDDDDTYDRIFYVRPTIKGSEGKLYDKSSGFGGECAFLTTDGCQLVPEKRPYECGTLKPKTADNPNCSHDFGVSDTLRMWKPYQEGIIAALAKLGVTL
jgi:hypothetical protein